MALRPSSRCRHRASPPEIILVVLAAFFSHLATHGGAVGLIVIFITEQDYFEVPYDGGVNVMKVINPVTYRGDKPVGYVIIARPQ